VATVISSTVLTNTLLLNGSIPRTNSLHTADFEPPILPLAKGPERNAADLVVTGESAMLGCQLATLLSDSHSLIRLLGVGAPPRAHPTRTHPMAMWYGARF
jgi:hypothetical protein